MEYSGFLQGYVQRQHAAGRNYTQIAVAIAVEYGYSLPIAHRIVEAVLSYDGNRNQLFQQPPDARIECPDIDTGNQMLGLDLGDIRAEVVFEQLAPRVVVLDNLMTPDECQAMCKLAEPKMKLAQVVSTDGEGCEHIVDIRDANTAFIEPDATALVTKVEARIARLTGWAPERGENLQIQRYLPGGRYVPHFDYFDQESIASKPALQAGGQRLGTLIVYLRSPEAGGATYLENLGIKIRPRRGSALFFSYPQASARSGTLHAGDPVLSGEKWILTKWFRERHG